MTKTRCRATTADVVVVFGVARVRHRFGRLLTLGSGGSLIGLGTYVAVAKMERQETASRRPRRPRPASTGSTRRRLPR